MYRWVMRLLQVVAASTELVASTGRRPPGFEWGGGGGGAHFQMLCGHNCNGQQSRTAGLSAVKLLF